MRVCGPRSLEPKTAPCASFTGLGAVSGTSSSRMALTRCESGRCAATHAEAEQITGCSRPCEGERSWAASGQSCSRTERSRTARAADQRAEHGQSCSRTAHELLTSCRQGSRPRSNTGRAALGQPGRPISRPNTDRAALGQPTSFVGAALRPGQGRAQNQRDTRRRARQDAGRATPPVRGQEWHRMIGPEMHADVPVHVDACGPDHPTGVGYGPDALQRVVAVRLVVDDGDLLPARGSTPVRGRVKNEGACTGSRERERLTRADRTRT